MFRHRRWSIPFRSLHIRAQLTLLYMLIFVLLICLLGVVFYTNLQSSLETNVDTELQEHAQEIAGGVQFVKGKLSVQGITSGFPGLIDADSGSDAPPGETATKATPTTKNTSAGSSISLSTKVDIGPLVRILDNAQTVLFVSPAFRELSVPQTSVTQALRDAPWIGTVMALGGEPVRLYSLPLVYKNNV
ncbi:MAG TPA: hypothetical protein VGT44_14715, partial [Ktedonobacteraceae bacterium]|nr:hypothetical protein [Ktedonobacteraceae bacterium]